MSPICSLALLAANLQSLERVFEVKKRKEARIAERKAEKVAQQKAAKQAEKLRRKQERQTAARLQAEQEAQRRQLKRAQQNKKSAAAAGVHSASCMLFCLMLDVSPGACFGMTGSGTHSIMGASKVCLQAHSNLLRATCAMHK